MCFSASASFGIGAVLLAGGVATYKQAKTSSQKAFAMIPFIFSVQQFCEGVIWLSFKDAQMEHLRIFFTYGFLLFAQVIWPTWVPLSVLKMESDPARKKRLRFLFIIGIILSAYLLFCLLAYPVKVVVSTMHLKYELNRPDSILNYISTHFYFISIIIPTFISGVKRIALVGYFSLTSFIVTVLFFSEYIISVWCFFAAAISMSVFVVLKGSLASRSLKPITFN
jgi:hypothetical protein